MTEFKGEMLEIVPEIATDNCCFMHKVFRKELWTKPLQNEGSRQYWLALRQSWVALSKVAAISWAGWDRFDWVWLPPSAANTMRFRKELLKHSSGGLFSCPVHDDSKSKNISCGALEDNAVDKGRSIDMVIFWGRGTKGQNTTNFGWTEETKKVERDDICVILALLTGDPRSFKFWLRLALFLHPKLFVCDKTTWGEDPKSTWKMVT